MPCSGQTRCSEKRVSSGGSALKLWTVSTPSPNCRAVSTESVSRERKLFSSSSVIMLADHQPVDDRLDGVVLVAVQLDLALTQFDAPHH